MASNITASWWNTPLIIISAIGSIGLIPWILDNYGSVPDMNITATVDGNSTSRIVRFTVTNNWISTAEDVRVTYLANGQIKEPIKRMTPEQLTIYVIEDRSTFVGTLPRLVPSSKVEVTLKIENGTKGYFDHIWATNKKSQAEQIVNPEILGVPQSTMFPKYSAVLIGYVIVVIAFGFLYRNYRRSLNPHFASASSHIPIPLLEKIFFGVGIGIGIFIFLLVDLVEGLTASKLLQITPSIVALYIWLFILAILTIVFGLVDFLRWHIDPRLRYFIAVIYGSDIGSTVVFASIILTRLGFAS